jgi:DNA-binding NtrC family response regulator
MLPISDALVGGSPAISAVRDEMLYAARSDAKVLITGESGVGKEVVARLVHAESLRHHCAFVTVNCAGVPESLLESELFGHERGSFTGAFRSRAGLLEQADKGTIFMDEVGEMTPRMQVVLLRFLETGEIQRVGADRPTGRVNARVIAATNRNLASRIATGDFREDLYYRLNVVHIWIPPLRERREDIPLLLRHFLGQYAAQYAVAPPRIGPDAEARLVAYGWPGNVRELRNLVERMTVRKAGAVVTPADIEPMLANRPERAPTPVLPLPMSTADLLFSRIVDEGESFWRAVHEPFMCRDLTRDDLRLLIGRGLAITHGNYKGLLRLFNMDQRDYKKLLNFLHKYGCNARMLHPAPPVRDPRRMSPLAS